MKTLNKKEQRQTNLTRHYAFLERLSEFLGNKQDGKKLSLKLLKLEREAHKAATDYCNGDNGMTIDKWKTVSDQIRFEVEKLFEVAVPGLMINGDARGYAIKIDDEKVRNFYPSEIGFHRDWGGYGILAPDFK
jgi:hypothetical protein